MTNNCKQGKKFLHAYGTQQLTEGFKFKWKKTQTVTKGG